MGFKKGNKIANTHSMWGTPTYITWNNMKNRCLHKSNKGYKHYGDRGITFDTKWETFKGFFDDMGERPEGKTLDRIDNSKGYFKENCRWATPSQQNKNKRPYSNTGEKHITEYKGKFIVAVKPFNNKSFSDFEEAKSMRATLLEFRENNIIYQGDSMKPEYLVFKKLKSTGNYENEEVEVRALVEEGDNLLDSCIQLRAVCIAALEKTITFTTDKKEETNEPKEEKKTTKKKATVTKKTTKKKAKAKSESEPVADAKLDEEGSGEDAGNNEYELSDVKKALAKVWKTKGENIAKDIVKSFGVSRSDELSEDQFGAVIEECTACLK